MTVTTDQRARRTHRGRFVGIGAVLLALTLSACGGESDSNDKVDSPTPTHTISANSAASPDQSLIDDQVLPVSTNPITNTSEVNALKIDSVLVENNEDAAGKDVSDHLEIALTNMGSAELTDFEIFYTFSDPATNISESYYAKLPTSFTIPAGGSRVVHFDNTGEVDHFPTNEFSLYYTNANAMDVTVTVSATDAAIQTKTVQKDAGGAEEAD